MQTVRQLAGFLAAALTAAGAGPSLADELFDYGAYLASECTSCHQPDGSFDGIPSIVGWPESLFIETMAHYRSGTRRHAIMENVARSLGETELSALARYFHKVSTED